MYGDRVLGIITDDDAFVSAPSRLPWTYSVLHTNIQECFNEAGVEILSPNYLALRDGKRVTTPRQYLPSEVSTRPSRASSS